MILPIRTFVLLLVIILPAKFSWAQEINVSDCSRSKEFARYLFFTHQYQLARHELERINFFCGPDSSSRLLLLQSLRKLKDYPGANQYFNDLKTDVDSLSAGFRNEYIRLLMVQGKYTEVLDSIKAGMVFEQKAEHHLGALLLLENWKDAREISFNYNENEGIKMNALREIALKGARSKRKSPWLAALMSALIPGSGKMYCGYWGDGAIAFSFSASSAFFAARAFNKYGSESIYPWIISGLAASYYLGNIYGGHHAAQHYNQNINQQLINETEQILYSDY